MAEVGLIYSMIPKISQQIGAIAKGRKNTQGWFFRGVDDFVSACHVPFYENGVFATTEVLDGAIREERVTKNGGSMIYTVIRMKTTFYASDGSNVSCIESGEGMDSADKSSSKAASISFKYAIQHTFMIPTELTEDSDQHAPEDSFPKDGNHGRDVDSEKRQPQQPPEVPQDRLDFNAFALAEVKAERLTMDRAKEFLTKAGGDYTKAKALCVEWIASADVPGDPL